MPAIHPQTRSLPTNVRARERGAWAAALGALAGLIVLHAFATGAAAAAGPVTADFKFDPSEPAAGQKVTFTSTSWSDGATIVRADWDLNQDGVVDVSGSPLAFTFSTPGNYRVTLLAHDSMGRTASTTRVVTVLAAAPAPPEPLPPPPPPELAPPLPPEPEPPFVPPAGELPPPPPPEPPAAATGASLLPATPAAISPFPIVRISGRYSARGSSGSADSADACCVRGCASRYRSSIRC